MSARGQSSDDEHGKEFPMYRTGSAVGGNRVQACDASEDLSPVDDDGHCLDLIAVNCCRVDDSSNLLIKRAHIRMNFALIKSCKMNN